MDKTILTSVIIAAISFIMQKTLSNLLYGFVLLVTRPFKKGDKISITQGSREVATGHLIKRTPLHIYVKDYERNVAIIPNSLLESCAVINSDYKTGVNYKNNIKISFDSDIVLAKQIILHSILSHPGTHNTEDNTYLIVKTVDNGIMIEYNIRTEDVDKSFDICSEIKEEIILTIQKEDTITLI